jgi:hypothetical protein
MYPGSRAVRSARHPAGRGREAPPPPAAASAKPGLPRARAAAARKSQAATPGHRGPGQRRRQLRSSSMTEIDFAYFNFEHVLSAYLPCLFPDGAGRPAGCLAAGLSRVAVAAGAGLRCPAARTASEAVPGRECPAGLRPGPVHCGAGGSAAPDRLLGAGTGRWRDHRGGHHDRGDHAGCRFGCTPSTCGSASPSTPDSSFYSFRPETSPHPSQEGARNDLAGHP